MTSKRRILPLIVVLLIWENLNSIYASPEFPSSSQSTSELLKSPPVKNTEISTPSVTVDEISGRKKVISTGLKDKTRLRDPPASPVKLFMPDEFQFYTLNNYGQLVMKQMTKQEIQGMIAASVGGAGVEVGDSLKEPGKHQGQLIDGVPKVSDVVHNVQKVLKGELNKPVQVHPSSSSIPGSVNSQWTNMLPYILSGGSVDQQDVVQDTSIILPTVDVDQTYVDVVPLHNGKPSNDHYESGSNYVHSQSTSNEQELKLVTPHKQTLSTSEKPIYLLGNMALDSDILEDQETYTIPTKDRPHRPVLTSMYQKFTTMKPFVTKNTATKLKNSTNGKPTLYIPVSISSLHKTNSHNKNNHGQLDIHKIHNISKPNQEKYTTVMTTHDANPTTKKTTSYDYSNESGFTKVPMIQVPIISAETIISTTQRINQQKTPVFEKLPTIYPSSTSWKEDLYATRNNAGSTSGFKKPTTHNRPLTSYHSTYETVTKPSMHGFPSVSPYNPIPETSSKGSISNKPSSAYHPVYEPIAKISTTKSTLTTQQPTQESITKSNIVSTPSIFTNNFINKLENKSNVITYKPELSLPSYQNSYTIIDALKTYTTEKSSLSLLEIVTKINNGNVETEETKLPFIIKDTINNNKNEDSPLVHIIQQIPDQQKFPTTSFLFKNTESNAVNVSKIPSYNNKENNLIVDSTTSYFINNKNYNTDAYTDITNKLTEKSNENETDKSTDNIYATTVPMNTQVNNKITPINNNITKNSNQFETVNKIMLSQNQILNTEGSSINTGLKNENQESKIGNNNDYYTLNIENYTTKQADITYKQTETTPVEITETIVTTYNTYSANIGELNKQNQSSASSITDKPEKTNTNSYIKITSNNKPEQSLTEIKLINSAQAHKYDKIPTWSQSELTTQVTSIEEGTTEYNTNKYNFNEVKTPISSAYEEPSIQESTTIPYTDNSNNYQTNVDSTIEYTTLLNKIIDLSNTDYSKQSLNENKTLKPMSNRHETIEKEINKTTAKIPGNSFVQNNNIDSKKPVYNDMQKEVTNNTTAYTYSTENLNNKITASTYINSYEIKPTNYDKLTTENFVSSNKNKDFNTKIYLIKPNEDIDSVMNYNKNSQEIGSVNKNKTQFLNLNTLIESADNTNNKSTIEYSPIIPNLTSEENHFNQYELLSTNNASKIEEDSNKLLIVQKENNKFDKYTTEITTDKINTLQDDELSTIKVIPVYDDDTSMYTLPSSNPSQIPVKVTTNIKPTEDSLDSTKLINLSSNKVLQNFKTTNQVYKPIHQNNYTGAGFVTMTSPIQNYITQNTPTYNTILPSLRETFDNYLKENYNTKSTTDNYNDISHLTTFSTEIYMPSLITLDKNSNDVSKHEIMPQKLQFNMNSTGVTSKNNGTESINDFSSTPSYTLENFDYFKTEENLESVTKNINVMEIYSTEYLDDNYSTFTTKYPEIKDTNNNETPIIYLDLGNQDYNKESSLNQLNNNTDDSSLTRIKIKNPVADIETLISEAQIPSNSPSIVDYILPNLYKEPNNIASGLIAGYPTYDQIKLTTEITTESTLYDNVNESSTSSTNKDSMYVTINKNSENILQEDKNVSYQEKSTTLTIENDKNYIDKTSSIPIYVTMGVETSTYNNEPFEATNYESFTTVPLEPLRIFSKTEIPSQGGAKNEKINNLLNQVKDKPTEYYSTGYELSNDVTTNMIPLEKLETVTDENNFTPNDDTPTTIFDNTNKVSPQSKNNTYVATQTPSYIKFYQNTTEKTGNYNATRIQNTEEATTQSIFKIKSSSGTTTYSTIMKQPITGIPFMTSTYSATKGLLEKTQSMIDKSAGRINLEEEKNKVQKVKPTEATKFTMKNKFYYSTDKRPTNEGFQSYTRKITRPTNKGTTAFIKEQTTTKPITVTKESNAEKWTQIPQKNIVDPMELKQLPASSKEGAQQLNPQIVTLDHANGAIGLDQSNKGLDKDVAEFLNICNELSFKFWTLANSELSSSRSLTLSPFGMISTLAMIYLGARGLTSNQMNDILKLDDVVTFNPHLVFQNITDTVTLARGQGIQNAAFVRALFADRLKVRKIMPFYKEQAQQFYEGAVVDINFSTAGDILRRRTNLLIRKQTGGRIKDFVKTHTVPLRSPLTALSANIFQTSCDSPDASTEGRDGEMYFAVSQTVKQRKLVPIPAVVWKSGVSAGYEPSLDATAVALGDTKRPVSLIMVMPGQQGLTAAGDNLERLEQRLFGNPSDNALEKLLKVIVPRRVEIQIPKFSHRSIVNITSALKKLGFDQLFTKTADLKGINGAGHDLYLADMLQMNLFYTCSDENKLGGRPLSETFPGTSSRHTRAWEIINNSKTGIDDYLENNESDDSKVRANSKHDNEDDCEDSLNLDDSSNSNENLEVSQSQLTQLEKGNTDGIYNLRQKLHKKRLWRFTPIKHRRCRTRRQAEIEKPRMKMDKPFLYLIRHNLTGLILHIGRFNPKNQS